MLSVDRSYQLRKSNMDRKITLEEIMKLRQSFYKTLLIFMTRKCPLRCRHCSVEAGPEYHESISLNIFESLMEGVKETGIVEMIAISGGEPFTQLDLLAEILSSVANRGLKAVVITSAFWASSFKDARRMIDHLPSFTALEISADEFHEEFFHIERVKYAVAAALERDLKVIIGLTNYRTDSFKNRLYEMLGSDLLEEVEFLENKVQPVGRAKRNFLVPIEYTQELPEGACRGICSPVVRYDGNVMACCQDEFIHTNDHCLWLGNLYKNSFTEIYQKANNSFFIQALRTIGPKGIIDIGIKERWQWRPRMYRKAHICDLCRDIIFSPYLISMFEEHAKDATFRHEIVIGRFLKYGEVMQV